MWFMTINGTIDNRTLLLLFGGSIEIVSMKVREDPARYAVVLCGFFGIGMTTCLFPRNVFTQRVASLLFCVEWVSL